MAPVVAIIAQGAMGAGIAARLHAHGVQVLTSLEGRSEKSAARAKAAGMIAASENEIAAADIILSIVPPSEALSLAKRLAPALTAATRKPLYADCNAISPGTVADVEALIAQTCCPFVDAGIIGGPPREGYTPVLYCSGAQAKALLPLRDLGLDIRPLEGPIGAASGLKMCYAGLTKGFTALGAAMLLAAERSGAAPALHEELKASQPGLLAFLTRGVPDMFAKAYRWEGEMREIADFTGGGPEQDIYTAIAALYARLAADMAGERREIGQLAGFFGPQVPKG